MLVDAFGGSPYQRSKVKYVNSNSNSNSNSNGYYYHCASFFIVRAAVNNTIYSIPVMMVASFVCSLFTSL